MKIENSLPPGERGGGDTLCCFLPRNQNKCYKAAKENINAEEAIFHVDFSGNYDNKQQHAMQIAYFG